MPSGKRIWHIIRNVILILIVLAAGFFFLFVPWFFTHMVMDRGFHYPDPNDGKSPESYGMHFQAASFPAMDGIPLVGWFVPATGEPKGTIVYVHGLNRTRIEMLPMAQFGHSLGYNGLLFDLRHQGQSGGKLTTIGYKERLDVEGAVKYVLNEHKAPEPIIVWGVSMGAAAGLLAAAETPQVSAVISDSSFLSLRNTVYHHWRLFFHLPTFPMANEITGLAAWKGGYSPSDFDCEKAVERIGDRPILFVAVDGDRRMPPSVAQTLYAQAKSPLKKIIVLHGHRHGEGFKEATDAYENAVAAFLASVGK
jgi:fermentation-respiration switch protein FrsA (DUF1100 family)